MHRKLDLSEIESLKTSSENLLEILKETKNSMPFIKDNNHKKNQEPSVCLDLINLQNGALVVPIYISSRNLIHSKSFLLVLYYLPLQIMLEYFRFLSLLSYLIPKLKKRFRIK